MGIRRTSRLFVVVLRSGPISLRPPFAKDPVFITRPALRTLTRPAAALSLEYKGEGRGFVDLRSLVLARSGSPYQRRQILRRLQSPLAPICSGRGAGGEGPIRVHSPNTSPNPNSRTLLRPTCAIAGTARYHLYAMAQKACRTVLRPLRGQDCMLDRQLLQSVRYRFGQPVQGCNPGRTIGQRFQHQRRIG